MNYHVIRDDQEFGPYSLADLQQYVAQGSILPTDHARSEGMEQTVEVQQIIGNIRCRPRLRLKTTVRSLDTPLDTQVRRRVRPRLRQWGCRPGCTGSSSWC